LATLQITRQYVLVGQQQFGGAFLPQTPRGRVNTTHAILGGNACCMIISTAGILLQGLGKAKKQKEKRSY
jgi:hypothetical protein